MTRIDEHNLIAELLESFPELENPFNDEVAGWRGEKRPSNYDVVGFVFKPRFTADLETGTLTDFLRRSVNFIERVCESGDAEAINVIWIKLFEWLLMHPRELKLLEPELGPKSRVAITDAASRWNIVANFG